MVSWLEGRVIGEPVDGEPFNWELLAFTAAARANEERSLAWARVALGVYSALAEKASGRDSTSLMSAAMNLRASMIREFGAQKANEVLDPEHIVAWFHRIAPLSIEEATRFCAQDLPTLPIETIRQLRALKNALNVVDLIARPDLLLAHPELERWLQIKPRLP
ncbi:hypothetical protein P2318_33350 [Myxococcaceae bacterium GXIMD 01537]